MNFYRYRNIISLSLAFIFLLCSTASSQDRDNLPREFREYTNPEEIVTFDRTTSFARAVDVINEFAQQFRGKIVINRTETSGEIGISVPPMHWMDALKLILRVNNLYLVEQPEYYEIVTRESLEAETQPQTTGATGQTGGGEGPVATTQTHEVRINAIFFEGNRRALREIGVDWSTISENVPDEILGGGDGGQGGGGQGGGQGGDRPSIPDSRFDGPFVQINSKGAQDVSENVFNSLINFGEIGNTGIRVQALFSAFEADNLGEILASPTVKVMDGQEGQIQVGQDFSIKQRDIAGNVVENFFSVGTILTVTPQVITQNDTTFIHLDIAAERSSAQPDPVSTVINKQEAETQSLLLDGEATVIAGLYRAEKVEVRRGLPILKDLPPWFFGLRYLFGYTSNDQQMRELVIVLQASLEPTIPERIAQDGLKGKYEVLQDERIRMHEELQRGDRILQGDDMDVEYDADELPNQDTAETDLEEEVEEEYEEDDIETEPDTTENEQKKDVKKQEKAEEPPVTDPEIETEEIQINLGGNEQDTTEQIDRGEELEEQSVNEEERSVVTYYLVGGSFEQEENALAFRDKLRGNGFDPVIIQMQESDIYLVAYRSYEDLGKARAELESIQQDENSEAWLYRTNS